MAISSRPKILGVGPAQGALEEFKQLAQDYEVHMVDRGPREEVKARIAELARTHGPFSAAFVLFANGSYAPLDEDLLAPLWVNGNNIGVFSLCGSGYDNCRVDEFSKHGCFVTNTPDAVTEATADFTVLLFLSVLRGVSHCESLVRAGVWRTGMALTDDPRGKTIGVFGMGRIAKSFVRKIRPFGNKVIYNVRNQLDEAAERELGITFVTKDELCRSADVIVTLCPGTPETYHLLDDAQFGMMREGVYIINTSRGSVISNDALVSALKTGKVQRAGLDVVDGEPEVPEYLCNNPRVTITPHVAAYSKGTIYAGERDAFDNVRAFLETGKPVSPVNGPF